MVETWADRPAVPGLMCIFCISYSIAAAKDKLIRPTGEENRGGRR